MKIEIDAIDSAMSAESAKCSMEAQQLIYAARNPNNKAMAKSLQHKADKSWYNIYVPGEGDL